MPLELHWVALILLAALIHASWNALNKASSDRLLSMAILTGAGGLAAGLLIPFVPPPAPAAWPWLAGSVVLHLAYQLSLVRAYRLGDLSQVYPIARGLAPLGIALFAALTAGEVPSPLSTAGLIVAAGAIVSLSVVGRSSHPGRAPPGTGAALQTALLISLYTVVDAHGVRASGSPLGYIAWMSLLHVVPILIIAAVLRRSRFLRFLRTDGLRNALGGILAIVAYGIVLAAMASGAMAHVAALRETSVVFAALIGTWLLKEQFGLRRLLASGLLAMGLILMQLG